MLRLFTDFENVPVISVHAGGKIAVTAKAIIDPRDLSIAGFYLNYKGEQTILLSQDIREIGPSSVVINHEEDLAAPDELIRLQDVLGYNFSPLGKKVATESGKKLGEVEDYVINDDSWLVQKIHVHQAAWRSLASSAKIIDRNQIVKVDDTTITVNDASVSMPKTAARPAPIN